MKHKPTRRAGAIVRCLLVLVACVWTTGCNAETAATTLTEAHIRTPPTSTPSPTVDNCRPLKVVVLVDKTASAATNHIENVEMAHVETLVRLANECGGAIALGLITDRSDRALERYSIKPPRASPLPPPVNLPPFEFAERHAEYERALRQTQVDNEDRLKERTHEREKFLGNARALLEIPALARRRDVAGAISRADVFLAEREVDVTTTARRYLVLVSDTLDNVRRPLPELQGGAAILVATAGTISSLVADLGPERFESVQAAIDYVVSSANPRKTG